MKFNFWKKKVKLNETEINLLNKIDLFLETTSERMVEDIASIINGDYGLNKKFTKADIESFDFELKVDGYTIGFYPMDANNTQLGYKKTLPEYPNGFLRDIDLNIDDEEYDYDNEDDMDRMEEFDEQLQTKVLEWFNACWKKAGGQDCKDNYTIKIHDSERSFDLKRQKWIQN